MYPYFLIYIYLRKLSFFELFKGQKLYEEKWYIDYQDDFILFTDLEALNPISLHITFLVG